MTGSINTARHADVAERIGLKHIPRANGPRGCTLLSFQRPLRLATGFAALCAESRPAPAPEGTDEYSAARATTQGRRRHDRALPARLGCSGDPNPPVATLSRLQDLAVE